MLVTMNPKREIAVGDLLVEDGKIAAIGKNLKAPRDAKVLDVSEKIVLPGFVQGHVHLCQTLFRNRAEELALLDWLQQWIWPLEALHNEKTIRASARLGLCELIDSGVTSILDMGTVHHTDFVFQEIEKSGIRALCGKAMMDHDPEGIVPLGLREKTKVSIDESLALWKRWHGKSDGRIGYAFAPRFALSCSQESLEEVGRLSEKHQLVVHTHASENRSEVELVRKITGQSNIRFLDKVGLTKHHLAVAHAIHLEPGEIEILKKRGAGVSHCPGSNLKLASGIAPIPALRKAKVPVSLGSDAGACNNRLDIFREMFLAAALQKVEHGPKALAPREVLAMATSEGARAIGLGDITGSLEVGKRADLAILDLQLPHSSPSPDLYAAIVYSADTRNVETVICDGEILKENGKLKRYEPREVATKAREAWQTLSR